MESSNTLGKYQILREIARSNDIVYEAIDPGINRRVALKELCLPPNLTGAQKRERIERFYREAKAAGRLAHPNIVTIYDAGEQNGRYYIAMEFLEGQDLQNAMQARGGAMPVPEAVSIALAICDALAYAHQQGVVHRDIKPDNIQILPGGLVKLTDFGIARLMSEPSITQDGQVFGTPSYMSPEQVAGKPLDHRTDIFSLGVVLFEMLAGRKPFTGDSVVTITYNIMNMDPALPPGVPPYLTQIIRGAMAKDPNQRYTTAAEMADDLRNERASGSVTGQFNAQPTHYGGAGLPPPGGYAPSGGYSQPAPPIPDPFGGAAKQIDLPLPPPPRRPMVINPEIKAFFTLAAVVLGLIALFLFSVWALNAAYQGYMERQGESKTARDMELGAKAYDAHDYDTAIRHFRRALDISPKSGAGETARKNLASCYVAKGTDQYNAGHLTLAADMFREAIKHDPKSAAAHYALGNTLQRVGSVDDALAEWRKAVEVGAGTQEGRLAGEAAGWVYFNRGVERFNNGQTKEALDSWTKVIEVAPGSEVSNQAQERINQQFAAPVN
ncbi:MAG: serine/threonine-protein kinase [Armatimonadota bacterium]|nr:serine/threonine-protein kinase [Armatimonadota bacterium]